MDKVTILFDPEGNDIGYAVNLEQTEEGFTADSIRLGDCWLTKEEI